MYKSDNIPMHFGRKEDRILNYVNVRIFVQEDCNPHEGEYSVHITGFTGELELDVPGGMDDPTLILEAVEEHVEDFPKHGSLDIILKESGEWEGYSWNKFYEIERIIKTEIPEDLREIPQNNKVKPEIVNRAPYRF